LLTILLADPIQAMSVENMSETSDTVTAAHTAATPLRRPNFLVRISAGNTIVGTKYGHGICLDSPCVHVLTNYHVPGLIEGAKVEGVKIKTLQSATGPNDPDAVPFQVMGTLERWNPQRDLALITLKKALPGSFGAARFADYEPSVGTSVVRYPTAGAFRGKLIHNGAIRYLDGTGTRRHVNAMLLSDFDSPLGVSGGALCDSEDRVLGVTELNVGSLAIPVPVVAAFLLSADPELWHRLQFRKVQRVAETHDEVLDDDAPTLVFQTSMDVHAAVAAMIERAEEMRLRMARVVARSEVRQSGPGVSNSPQQYEVSLYDEGIRFRKVFPNGDLGQETPDVALPVIGVIPSANWDYFLAGLRGATVRYLGETFHRDEIGHVFSFDMLCPWRELRPDGVWEGDVACKGQVITDLAYHPAQIKASYEFEPRSTMSQLVFDIQFQRFLLGDDSALELPSLVSVRAKYKRSPGTYFGSNTLSHYRPFASDHVIHYD